MLTRAFTTLLDLLERHEVEFLIIGSFATSALARPRFVKDLDLWVGRAAPNVARVLAVLDEAGLGGLGITADDFASDTVLELGYAPVLVDLMARQFEPRRGFTFAFEDEYPRRLEVRVDGTRFPLARREFHVEIKRLIGRLQDVADVRALEEGDPLGRTIEERIREVERLRRLDPAETGDPDRPIARALRRKRVLTKS